ncbi:hypothetical protein [Salibacter halophilus]|uniref:Uncharacterized protein n=1 Tax=Salibacter halophilus TaxID=1803916 RepID=A0A6N6M6S4_9FLAO|nr:hypothetical protein [Salibacter halophilus]KAB1065498.1 hypothetical protein F3059_02260 [Salibacter halophilus]
MMTRSTIIFLLTSIVTVFSASIAYSQSRSIYDGEYRFGGKNYNVKFNYFENDGDTLLDGEFEAFHQFESSNDEFEYTSLNGEFIENELDSKWEIKTGTFEPEGDGVYDDYSFSYTVNGNEFHAELQFDEGELTGNWQFFDWKIRNSEIFDTTLYGSVSYVDNLISNFSFDQQGNSLTGKLDSACVAEGVWKFYSTSNGEKIKKSWVFKNKHLSKVEIKRGDENDLEISLMDTVGKNSIEETKELDRAFLEILKLKIAIRQPALIEGFTQAEDLNELYFDFLDQYNKIDDILHPLRKETLFPEMKSKIYRFPYTDSEETSLNSIIKDHEKTRDIINSILDDPQVNIASISDEEIARYEAVLKKIREGFYSQQKDFIELYLNNYLPYLDRNEVIEFKFDLQEVIKLNNDSSSNDYPLKANYDYLENTELSELQKLERYSKNILEDLELIQSDVEQFVSKYKRQKQLVDIESKLIEKYDSVKYLNDSLITAEYNSFAKIDVNRAIAQFADSSLKAYSGLNTENEKMERAKNLLSCYEKAEDLIYTVHQSTENIYKINEAYTREVFNPYTYTNMEEKAKPSIYNSFSNVLLPGIFQNLNRLSCENISAYSQNFSVLFEGMMNFLKDENTNRAERKVKRTESASEAAEVLNLELTF